MYNRQLETFIAVAREGSFNKAAEKLYISPNAIMKQINLLEDRLGFPLFERTHTGLKLTPSGESILHDSQYVIQYCQEAVIRAKEKSQSDLIIRIGKSFTTPVGFILDLWMKISEIEPKLKISFISFENNPKNAKEILGHLGDSIDLVAGVYSEGFVKRRNCQAYYLYSTPIRIGVPYNHPLYNKSKLTIEDLKNETVLLIQPHHMEDFDEVRKELLNDPEITIENFESFDVNIFNRCVNESKLMVTVDEWKDIHPMIQMIPIEWNYTIPFGIMYSLAPSTQVQRFIQALKKIM